MQTKANLAKAKAVLGMGGAQILLQCRPVLFTSVQTQHSPPHTYPSYQPLRQLSIVCQEEAAL